MSYIIILSIFSVLILTPIMIRVAKKYNIVDKPDSYLKPHEKATPYLGGLIVYFSIIPFLLNYSIYLFMGCTTIMLLGLLDDLKDVSPKFRFIIEIFICFFSVIFVFNNANIIELFFYTFTGVALINAVNMLDGMDGLCTGLSIINLLIFFFITNDIFYLLILIPLGVFLLFNFNPAKIFLGDAGAYLLGYLLYFGILNLSKTGNFNGYITGIIINAVFFTDMFFAILRRLKNGRSPFSGDREHIYDKIRTKLTISIKKTVLILYLITVIFGLISLISWYFNFIGVIICVIVILIIAKKLNLYNYNN